MPSKQVLEAKQQVVAQLFEQLKNATTGVFVDYSGINVADDTALRKKFREAGVQYGVVKNTLTRFAAKEAGIDGLDDILNGTTALAVSADHVSAAKIIGEYAEKNDNFIIKGGFMEGKVMPLNEVMALAAIPPLPVLRAQVLGTMLAPISGLACVLKQIAEKQGGAVDAAEAPAAE